MTKKKIKLNRKERQTRVFHINKIKESSEVVYFLLSKKKRITRTELKEKLRSQSKFKKLYNIIIVFLYTSICFNAKIIKILNNN